MTIEINLHIVYQIGASKYSKVPAEWQDCILGKLGFYTANFFSIQELYFTLYCTALAQSFLYTNTQRKTAWMFESMPSLIFNKNVLLGNADHPMCLKSETINKEIKTNTLEMSFLSLLLLSKKKLACSREAELYPF